MVLEGPRGQGFKGSSEMLKNAKSADKIFRKQTLESLTPGILGPSSPTKLEKNLILMSNYLILHKNDFFSEQNFHLQIKISIPMNINLTASK